MATQDTDCAVIVPKLIGNCLDELAQRQEERFKKILIYCRKAKREIKELEAKNKDLDNLLKATSQKFFNLTLAHDTLKLEVQSLKRKVAELDGRQSLREVECPICTRPYDGTLIPVVGVCGHSICQTCRSRLEFHKNCPICRHRDSFREDICNFFAIEVLSRFYFADSDESGYPGVEDLEYEESVRGRVKMQWSEVERS